MRSPPNATTTRLAIALVGALGLLAWAEVFAGREQVELRELFAELERVAKELERAPAVRADFERLADTHDLPVTDSTFSEYVRVRLAFETTRDSGLWDVRWTITDREPRSDEIWRQWERFTGPARTTTTTRTTAPATTDTATASAECDELSALFAFVARGLGVTHVGLFWPQRNHTVAVWTTTGASGKPVRLVVPTSQVFLSPDATLGTREFDPWQQKTIHDYTRPDVTGDALLPGKLAGWFVEQARAASAPAEELQRRRARRSTVLGGS